jgi:cytosine/adenosine deaminase-related metal-dependent hydrolase
LATSNGAKVLNFSKLGKIQPDWGADLALFDVHKLEYAGALSDPLAALLFAGINHQSECTIINGKIVVEGGSLVGVDETELTAKANRIAARIQAGR